MGGETDRARVHPQMSAIAMPLDTVAGCVREYVGLPKAHDSLAMAELAQEAQFAKRYASEASSR